ncbi:hypothetical protein EKO04_000490 [Ascochyta lentis]|uniref:Uncharacterized protein n=1 Tax=Ascochyta lentis TaxID=205686 RepID=A0A8H7MM60_9PLEO|nr:hypothetical protein EKO04_000490 [Ascochyta lentis]
MPHTTVTSSSPDARLKDKTGSDATGNSMQRATCTRSAAIQTSLSSPLEATKASATARALFNLSRGYTEQQEWVGSLSSTLGREGASAKGKKGCREGKERRSQGEKEEERKGPWDIVTS